MLKHEFYTHLKGYMRKNMHMRKGQAAFNLMEILYPSIAEKHRGGNFDPFYNDAKVDAFIDECIKDTQ